MWIVDEERTHWIYIMEEAHTLFDVVLFGYLSSGNRHRDNSPPPPFFSLAGKACLYFARICEFFKEPGNRFLGSLNVYKFGLWGIAFVVGRTGTIAVFHQLRGVCRLKLGRKRLHLASKRWGPGGAVKLYDRKKAWYSFLYSYSVQKKKEEHNKIIQNDI